MSINNSPVENGEKLIKSKRRVADHGEVFTPRWLVDDMIDLVAEEAERIDSRFLEPACGSGNFLVPVLERKLTTVNTRYKKSDFELHNYALLALMSIYGIELLADNAAECRQNLLETFTRTLKLQEEDVFTRAARSVLELNIVQGDALTMATADGKPIQFSEWAYLGMGKFQRRDFLFDSLTQRSQASEGLFAHFQEHEIFTPVKSYPAMKVEEIAQ